MQLWSQIRHCQAQELSFDFLRQLLFQTQYIQESPHSKSGQHSINSSNFEYSTSSSSSSSATEISNTLTSQSLI